MSTVIEDVERRFKIISWVRKDPHSSNEARDRRRSAHSRGLEVFPSRRRRTTIIAKSSNGPKAVAFSERRLSVWGRGFLAVNQRIDLGYIRRTWVESKTVFARNPTRDTVVCAPLRI